MEKQIREKMSPQLQATRQITINLSVTHTQAKLNEYAHTHTHSISSTEAVVSVMHLWEIVVTSYRNVR